MLVPVVTACYLAALANDPASAELPSIERSAEVVRYSFELNEDRDYDGQPDDWTRRRGKGFPHYVRSRIDREAGSHGRSSLRFDVNGGPAIAYSPPIPVDAHHAYVFEAWIRTRGLKHDAALVSVSFLDHERERVHRFLSRPVTGTHADWVRVRIGPMAPVANVRFVAIGCHLVESRNRDFAGTVWFDDLWLGTVPRLTLASDVDTQYLRPDQPIRTTARVSGVRDAAEYRLVMTLRDRDGEPLIREELPVAPPRADTGGAADEEPEDGGGPAEVVWSAPSPGRGFFRVHAQLQRDGETLLAKRASVAVMDFVKPETTGEFGWAISASVLDAVTPEELVRVVGQAGVHRVKVPLWRLATDGPGRRATRTAEFLDLLTRAELKPVGMLESPPAELRGKFAEDWAGVSEVFAMPTAFWSDSLEPVMARYSSYVRYWQLGGDDDTSFVGSAGLTVPIAAAKRQLDRLGRDSVVGVRWTWDAPLPTAGELWRPFVTLGESEALAPEALLSRLRQNGAGSVRRWVVLRPAPRSQGDASTRANDLVKRMVFARIGGAEAVFATDVVDPEHGLLQPDGTPGTLFLPWRTFATALAGSEYLGSLRLPNGSANHVFARDGEVAVAVWNDEAAEKGEPILEEVYLGESVTAIDPWGRRTGVPVDGETGRQRLFVGPQPMLLAGCSAAVARWRLGVRFRQGRFDSATGQQAEAVLVENSFPQGLSGRVTLNLPPEWEAEPRRWTLQAAAGDAIELPTFLTLPPNTTLGRVPVTLDFELAADRPYGFRVYRDFEIGLDDLHIEVVDRKLEDGRLEIEQIITNDTEPLEVLDFDCSLFIPDHKRRKQLVTRLGKGQDRRFYVLPDAESLRGKRLWLRARQIGGRRVLNYRWTVGENWDE